MRATFTRARMATVRVRVVTRERARREMVVIDIFVIENLLLYYKIVTTFIFYVDYEFFSASIKF